MHPFFLFKVINSCSMLSLKYRTVHGVGLLYTAIEASYEAGSLFDWFSSGKKDASTIDNTGEKETAH